MAANAAKKQSDSIEEPVVMQVVKNENPDPVVVRVEESPVAEVQKEPELSLEQRISLVEDLTVLIDKWRKLQESYRNLQSFKIAVDGFSTQFMLRDTNSGREFKTSNSAVVASVIEEVRSTLSAKIAEVESQIKF